MKALRFHEGLGINFQYLFLTPAWGGGWLGAGGWGGWGGSFGFNSKPLTVALTLPLTLNPDMLSRLFYVCFAPGVASLVAMPWHTSCANVDLSQMQLANSKVMPADNLLHA